MATTVLLPILRVSCCAASATDNASAAANFLLLLRVHVCDRHRGLADPWLLQAGAKGHRFEL